MAVNDDHIVEYTKGSLPDRFDKWLRETLCYLIKTEVRSYIREKTGRREIFIEDMNCLFMDEAICEPLSEMETEMTMIGTTSVTLTDERLARALAHLSPRKMQVIEETIILGLSVRQAAERLNLAEQTIMNYKSDALRILKKQMERDSNGNKDEDTEK